MLKHCLLTHPDEEPEKISFGMRIKSQYRTPMERQIGEATAILLETMKKEKTLLNSKSEFNRCSLPRVTAGNHRDIMETLIEEDEEEKRIKADIRCMRKRKKREKEMRNRNVRDEDLLTVCNEILVENENR